MMSLVINTGCSCNPCLAASSSAFSHVHISIPTAFLPIFVFLLRISPQGLTWLDCYGCSLGEVLVSWVMFCHICGTLCVCEAFHMPKWRGFVYMKWTCSRTRSRSPSFTPLGQHPRNLQGSLITCLVPCPAVIASRLGLLERCPLLSERRLCKHLDMGLEQSQMWFTTLLKYSVALQTFFPPRWSFWRWFCCIIWCFFWR